MRSAAIAAFLLAAGVTPAAAQSLQLCPPTFVNTCYVGYVTARDRMVVLLSSAVRDVLVNREIEVTMRPRILSPGTDVSGNDLSKEIGHVVMLDAVGYETITDARLASVADPIVTALYLVLAKPPH